MMQNYNTNQGQPAFTEADVHWFNNAIQRSPWLQANPQLGLSTMAKVREFSHGSSQVSPVHNQVFQAFAQNNFQNQIWQQWCQLAVDFLELLCTQRQYDPYQAVTKAAKCTVESAMGVTFGSTPQLQAVTPNNFWAGLQAAQQMYQQMQIDIRNMRSGMGYPQQQQNQYGGGNLPPINVGSHQQYSGHQNYQSNQGAQVSGQSMISQYNSSPQYHSTNSGTSGDVANPLYDTPAYENTKPLVPAEEISSDAYGQSYYQEPAPMYTQQPEAQSQPVIEETNLPIPTKVSEVVVDPTYYQPTGFKLDINRAFDLIHNPGGIVIRPAQLTDWELTVGDDNPWPQLMDPSSYCLFYVKFPDGTVKEKFVEWTNSMDYLRHELDAELRRKAYRPNGIVVSSATPISTIGGDAMKLEEAVSLVQDGNLTRSKIPPVILPFVFQGSTDLEIEGQVREELSNQLEVNFSGDIPMPVVEYRSQFTHTLPLTEEAVASINDLVETKNLGQVAQGLRDLALQGDISIRVLRALNDRLTKAVNAVLADSMGQTAQIDDFCEDYLALEDYLEEKRGVALRRTLQGAAEVVLSRALNIVATDSGEEHSPTIYHVVDNYLNHQLGWDLADLASLNLKAGTPVLISSLAHPVILETLKGMISRANAQREEFNATLRVITRDGYYLEVLKGRLIENATLLKLVR